MDAPSDVSSPFADSLSAGAVASSDATDPDSKVTSWSDAGSGSGALGDSAAAASGSRTRRSFSWQVEQSTADRPPSAEPR
ncbi:hypothetical protein [Haloplanus litoreus]|uniref:hypothetical protein n=1 Tax=Haloplanus litoreus TaxID=767515 RepID=UPI0036D3D918